MMDKRNAWLPIVLLIVFAITRWPWEVGGERLLPVNFSAVYALIFCAGVYFRNRLGWWVPLAVMLASDIALNLFYYLPHGWNAFEGPRMFYQLMNYAAYAVIFWLGRRFKPRASFFALVGGGLLSALVFYLVTNTAAWLLNPFDNAEYRDHTWRSLLLALTLGTGKWPDTLQFFRNTFLSSGLFTALFVAAMKYSEHLESAAEKKAAEAPEDSEEAEPEAEKEAAT